MLLLFAAAMLWPQSATADSLRCSGRLIKDGDLATKVVRVCGEPSYRDPWWGQFPITGTPPMMEWTYNHGARRLMDVLLFRNDQLQAIRHDGYGFTPGPIPPSGSCTPVSIQPGLSKYRLLQACGKPLQSTRGYVHARIFWNRGTRYFSLGAAHPVYRERWIYNFGASHFQREVTLENARVVSVKLLDRGFNPR